MSSRALSTDTSVQETIALAGDPVAQQEIAEADAAYAKGD
jgi:hypothetical protein